MTDEKLDLAQEANEKLRSSMELRALVELATQATKGAVCFLYSTQDRDLTSKTPILYVFEGGKEPMTVEAASEWLQQITREAT